MLIWWLINKRTRPVLLKIPVSNGAFLPSLWYFENPAGVHQSLVILACAGHLSIRVEWLSDGEVL